MRAQETKLREPLSVQKLGGDGAMLSSTPTQPYEGLLSVFEDGVIEQMNDASASSDPWASFSCWAYLVTRPKQGSRLEEQSVAQTQCLT